tara:strand:+ start:811 stop:1437 length:627 start_codon:yes stop_codon:yes gene_type:complete
MGSKPKQQDYQASAAEKTSASVAMAEYQNFKKKYDPLLQEMRDKSLTADVTSGLRGRANADTMQALTSQPSYQNTQSNTATGDMAQAYQGQLGIANTSGKDIQNKMQSNVLGTARGQVADAQTGMAQASRLGTSQALTRAKANQDVAQAKMNAAVEIGTAVVGEGLKNKQGGGTFFTPNNNAGKGNQSAFNSGGSLSDRLSASQARGF